MQFFFETIIYIEMIQMAHRLNDSQTKACTTCIGSILVEGFKNPLAVKRLSEAIIFKAQAIGFYFYEYFAAGNIMKNSIAQQIGDKNAGKGFVHHYHEFV